MAPGPPSYWIRAKVDRRQSQPLLGSESSKVRQNESLSPFGSCFIDGRSLFLRGDRGWNQDFEVWQEGVGSKYWRMLATPMTHQVKGKSLDLYIQSRLVEAPVRMQLSYATAPAFVAVEDALSPNVASRYVLACARTSPLQDLQPERLQQSSQLIHELPEKQNGYCWTRRSQVQGGHATRLQLCLTLSYRGWVSDKDS
jgi:hypothetical protein